MLPKFRIAMKLFEIKAQKWYATLNEYLQAVRFG